jgi:hypothetical protein
MNSPSFLFSPEQTHEEKFIFQNCEYSIGIEDLFFKRWKGQPMKNTFGKKPLIDYKGMPLFAELAIQHLLVKEGWSARWVCTYSTSKKKPYLLADWEDKPLINQKKEPINDIFCENLLEKISFENGNSYQGCWDIVAWKNSNILFVESKHKGKDRIRESQFRWFKTGLSVGLSIKNFLIVEWEFES